MYIVSKYPRALTSENFAAAIARRFFDRSEHAHKIILREGEANNELALLVEGSDGGEDGEGGAFDLVFLDAGKRDYARQRALLLEHNLIRVGGLVVADNVLWAGAVPLHSEALECGDAEASAPPRQRHEKVTRALHDYVAQTAADARWQQLILPLRDGLSVCRRVRPPQPAGAPGQLHGEYSNLMSELSGKPRPPQLPTVPPSPQPPTFPPEGGFVTTFAVWVGGLPPHFDDNSLMQLFGAYGDISSCSVVKDRATGLSRNFGFVNFKSQQDAETAIQNVNGQQVEGRTIHARLKGVIKP